MAIFTVMGCDDNKFLEEDPETFYTIDNVFTTSEQVDQVLTTCYIKVHNIYCPYNNFGELNLWLEFGIRQSLYHCSGPILQSFCLQKFRRTIWRSSVGNRNNFYS